MFSVNSNWIALCQNCCRTLNKHLWNKRWINIFALINSELLFFQIQTSTSLGTSQISQKIIPLLELPSVSEDGKMKLLKDIFLTLLKFLFWGVFFSKDHIEEGKYLFLLKSRLLVEVLWTKDRLTWENKQIYWHLYFTGTCKKLRDE